MNLYGTIFGKKIKKGQCTTFFDDHFMNFFVNLYYPNSLKAPHFKFLGGKFNPMTNKKDIKKQIISFLTKDMETIEFSKLNSFMKLWFYQFYALSHLPWPFIINDLDASFSSDLQIIIN